MSWAESNNFKPFHDLVEQCTPQDDPQITHTTVPCCYFNDETGGFSKVFDGWFEGLEDGDYSIQSPGLGAISFCNYY